jgi:hypothetical protein
MMPFINSNGESSLSDVAVNKYGNMEALFDIAIANGVSPDTVPVLDGEVQLPVLELIRKTVKNNRKPLPIYPFVKAGGDQALIDIAMQEAGTVESLFEVALLNGICLTDDLTPDHEYKRPALVNAKVVSVFSGAVKPASNTPVDEEQLPVELNGIDYWYIENTFIVS